MSIPNPELRLLLQEMVRQLGPERAALEWLMDGLPTIPPTGPHMRLPPHYFYRMRQ